MRFVGLDLAWGPANRTGIAVLDDDGNLVHLSSVVTDDEILATLAPFTRDSSLVAIDAPLVVTNLKGARPAERELNSVFNVFEAGARPAFKSNALFDPPRGAVLAQRGGLDIDPYSTAQRRAIEVYPHPATVALFRLDRTLKYKRGSHVDRKSAMLQLTSHLEWLSGASPSMQVAGASWQAVRNAVQEAQTHVALDLAEDQIDAVVCAYVAMFFHHRRDETTIFGSYPHNGYIVTPTLPADLRASRRKSLPSAPNSERAAAGEKK